MLLQDLVDEYIYDGLTKGYTKKTINNKTHEFRQFLRIMKEKRGVNEIEQVTSHDMKAYIRIKQQDGLQQQSIVSMLKMVKAFFNWCVKEEYIAESPMKKVDMPKIPKKVINAFDNNDVIRMINVFSYSDYFEARNKAIIAMLADCGLRAMELRGLKSGDINETAMLVNGKGNKQRTVFISTHLKRILIRFERIKKEHFANKDHTDHYFLSYLGDGLSHLGIYRIIKEAGERAGIEGKRVSPHTFRHYYAVQTLNSGNIDIYSLSRLLGHSDVSTTQRYLNSLSDAQLEVKALSSSPLSNLKGK